MKERGNVNLKLLDRYVGIPLVMLMGLLRRKCRTPPKEIRTICLFKEVSIGDTVLLAGPLRDLRKAFPEARILFFAGISNLATARMLPCVDEVLLVPVTSPLQGIREIRKHKIDVWLDFGQWERINSVFAGLSKARFRVGFRTPGQYRHFTYDRAVPHRADQHEVDNYRDILRALGIEASEQTRIDPGKVSSPLQGRFVVLHAWPSGMKSHLREWPAERWVELAHRIQHSGFSVVLTGSPADHPRTEMLERDIGGNVINRAGKDNLEALRSLLGAATAVVSVNTGVMHLAAALGTPTISLNGPTSELRWGPHGPRAYSVSVPPPYGGYLNLGFEYEGQYTESMNHIEVDAVWNLLCAQLPSLEESEAQDWDTGSRDLASVSLR